MTIKHKIVKFRLSSWNKLRRVFYGRKNENFSDYIERLSECVKSSNEFFRMGSKAAKETLEVLNERT